MISKRATHICAKHARRDVDSRGAKPTNGVRGIRVALAIWPDTGAVAMGVQSAVNTVNTESVLPELNRLRNKGVLQKVLLR